MTDLHNFPSLDDLALTPEQQEQWEAIKDDYANAIYDAEKKYKEARRSAQEGYNKALEALIAEADTD